MKGLIGRKKNVCQLFTLDGSVLPVTIVEVLPNFVSQVKTEKQDGYSALQLATGFRKKKNLSKPLIYHLAKTGLKEKRVIAEFANMNSYKLGEQVLVSLFQSGDFVNVQAVSKGKGMSGVIKRHNFSRGPMTHGSKHHRAPGSVGLSRPDKVWKGQPLPGRKGGQKTTVKNLLVVKVDEQKNLLVVKGTFAGPLNSFCKIHLSSTKSKTSSVRLFSFLTDQKNEISSGEEKNSVGTKVNKDLGQDKEISSSLKVSNG